MEDVDPSDRAIPNVVAGAGAVLAVSAAAPWTPDGLSYLDLLRGEFSRGLLEGVLMLVGFGSPFLFGLVVAGLPWFGSSRVAAPVIRMPIAFMHSQLVLVMIVLVSAGFGVAALPMLGFALASGVFLAVHTARTHAAAGGPRVGWYVRWGAMVVAAVTAWMELQRAGDLTFGWGLHLALGSAIAIVGLMAGRKLSDPAPAREQAPRPSTLL